MKTYTFHVSLPGTGRMWRKIEMRADQTLEILHYAIQDAYDWDADHLYSFFMSGKAWDESTEYCLPEDVGPFDAFDDDDFDDEEWDDDEDEDWEEDELEDLTAEQVEEVNNFVKTILTMVAEGKSIEEIKAEAYRLSERTPEEMSPEDHQALDMMIQSVQDLASRVPPGMVTALWDDLASGALMDFDAPAGDVRTTTLEALKLKPKQEFMYLFDYGDEWRFKVRVHAINPDAPEADYPLIVESVGDAPTQYPDWEDEENWDEEEDELEE